MSADIGRARGRPRSIKDTSKSTQIQSLDRAIEVLKVVSGGSGMSLTDIAKASEQPASTAYRILVTLEKHRIVEFVEPMQLWYISLEAFRIGSSFLGRTQIVEQSRPVMRRVMIKTGETANLAIVDRGEVIFVSHVETHESIRAFFRPGTHGPIHASGVGKALLAFFADAQIASILKRRKRDAFTAKTIIGEGDLLCELKKIRERGWAVDDEERTTGMRCIAAPIFDQFGEAVAGLSLSGPSVRMTSERDSEYGMLVRKAADQITRSIGGMPPTYRN